MSRYGERMLMSTTISYFIMCVREKERKKTEKNRNNRQTVRWVDRDKQIGTASQMETDTETDRDS